MVWAGRGGAPDQDLRRHGGGQLFTCGLISPPTGRLQPAPATERHKAHPLCMAFHAALPASVQVWGPGLVIREMPAQGVWQ